MLNKVKVGSTEQNFIYAANSFGINDKNQIAYILATVLHESAGTFKPIIESYWVRDRLIRKYGSKKGTRRFYRWLENTLPTSKYFPYVGRGYVQLTWDFNYKHYSDVLTKYYGSEYIDLVNNPSWAMIPDFAMIILIDGMRNGSFTGVGLSRYINEDKVDFVNARRIINGKDKARTIARYAEKYSRLL